MKIFILHGDDTIKSYERLKKFIETAQARSWEVAYLDDSDRSLRENLSSTSLFGAERFFILRDFRMLGKKDQEWLKKQSTEMPGNLIIYHEGTLNQTFLKSLPNSKVEEFKLPKLIWNFLEHMIPGNSKIALKEFNKIIEKDAPELIFSLIAKQFRDLYWVKVDAASTGFPSWKIGKLKSQSSKFTDEKLREIINNLAEIDIDVKTGKGELISSLDLLILKQLE